ncbi:large conductance mechanosensitive channel protein MscL [Mucilaginibacter pallidiroseus]|uniref:Large-conductance mechanosensitive channel n=1 Tax=Mucilaginibacter pallidiroseus TaxID=2599295 RepID=A0A563UK11_9SPHI|nr:large conductance mechanosensitive channel protein MscL [Mucilaginibacter pallidiroseus]TWR31695.1 large conductance mechanosensitive channel protein MscL [Mucilaginibacter pallidiroseus]
MGFVKEFKEFAVKGNVLDLAVAVVIGAAFSGIVKSLVDDIITPAVLTPALKAANLTNLAELTVPGTAIKYGNFISQVISFFIIALSLFLIITGINKFKKKEAVAPTVAPAPTKEEELLTQIRDILAAKNGTV